MDDPDVQGNLLNDNNENEIENAQSGIYSIVLKTPTADNNLSKSKGEFVIFSILS